MNFLLRLKILYCALADVTFIVFQKNSQSSGSKEQGCALNIRQLQKKILNFCSGADLSMFEMVNFTTLLSKIL